MKIKFVSVAILALAAHISPAHASAHRNLPVLRVGSPVVLLPGNQGVISDGHGRESLVTCSQEGDIRDTYRGREVAKVQFSSECRNDTGIYLIATAMISLEERLLPRCESESGRECTIGYRFESRRDDCEVTGIATPGSRPLVPSKIENPNAGFAEYTFELPARALRDCNLPGITSSPKFAEAAQAAKTAAAEACQANTGKPCIQPASLHFERTGYVCRIIGIGIPKK